jgi:hypothetical protein
MPVSCRDKTGGISRAWHHKRSRTLRSADVPGCISDRVSVAVGRHRQVADARIMVSLSYLNDEIVCTLPSSLAADALRPERYPDGTAVGPPCFRN